MTKTFTCNGCGQEFDEHPGDDERAIAEAKAAFGPDLDISTCAVLCDTCYQQATRNTRMEVDQSKRTEYLNQLPNELRQTINQAREANAQAVLSIFEMRDTGELTDKQFVIALALFSCDVVCIGDHVRAVENQTSRNST